MNDPAPRGIKPALESPGESYAGRTRHTQLEYEALLANASIGIAFTRDRRFFLCNQRFAEMFGWGPDELIGQPGEVVYTSRESYNALGQIAVPILSSGRQLDLEWELRRKDGSTFLCRMIAKALDAQNTQRGTVWIVEDFTEQRRAEDELQRVLAEQQALLDNVVVGIAFTRDRRNVRCNRRFEELFGFAPGAAVGSSARDMYFTDEEFARRDEIYEQLNRGRTHSREQWLRRQDGSGFWCRIAGRAVKAGDPAKGHVWLFEDITHAHEAEERVQQALDALERKVAERTAELEEAKARAQHMAGHDALTGLANRRLLEDRLTQALALSYRNRQQTAVMFIDLDRFKTINDSLGHTVGDALLKEVAQRLAKALRTGDTICRIGGDEFVVVLPEVKRSSDVAQVAQKVIEQLSAPVTVEERELVVTPSIGITVFPDDGRDAETLIRNADAAMYHAKEMGRANYQFFTEQMNLAAARRLALESDLRRALGRDQLRVHYQPIIEAKSGQIVGHEALVRWQNPHRGLVGPLEFIQVAEETGLILKIGEWVLREACRWATFIGVERGLQVAVNLSPRQFNDPKLVQLVAKALKDTGLPARLLELEITESTAMQHSDVALSTLNKLKELGVSIAIDDFGTGYSSLAYLKRFPVDKVKIDRAFVGDVPADADQSAIVSAIVALAHALEIQVIAEGVETVTQREFLKSCGCDFLQGYLTGRPVDADSAAKEYV
ncbi:MAG TPA: EAL domain-containing protein [Burkholderiales bacterium]|nr:EAL domain-containing protein [Burkholderiales bacterium]